MKYVTSRPLSIRQLLNCSLQVTEEDANDVVQLLHEAVLDTYTTGIGVVDFTGRKGGSSVAKQLKALVEVLTQQAQAKGSNLFTKASKLLYLLNQCLMQSCIISRRSLTWPCG